MPAVGQQRHRSEKRSCRDLANHHDSGKDNNEPGPPLVARVLVTEEYVIVGPWVEGVRVHWLFLGDAASCREIYAAQ
jgi:hypothetical protein